MTARTTLTAVLLGGALLAPATAAAHVTIQPPEAPAGAFAVESVRVPNESDEASATKVEVQFPDGIQAVRYQPVEGWRVKVTTKTLAEPIQTGDGPITEGVDRVTFTARNEAAGVGPGEFQEFPLSFQIPDKAGETLTFKAIETYSDGEVSRWIGSPDSEEPAPTLTILESEGDDHGGASHGGASGAAKTETTADSASAAEPTAASASSGDGGDGDGTTLAVVALVVGALGLAVGAAGFAKARSTTAT